MAADAPTPPTPRERFEKLWLAHGRSFWMLHSVWALATGIAVIWFARERYDFVYWVVGFLVLTWVTTLYFGRIASQQGPAATNRFGHGFASYTTRAMYQETLFFLLPFYAYSTVFPSWNALFLVFMAGLAVLACLDLVFDRWLREGPIFGLVFFASVTFTALNLLIPMLFSIGPALATPVAAVVAVVTAAPLSLLQGEGGAGSWWGRGVAAAAILGIAMGLPGVVPPVPLRLQEVVFSAGMDRDSLEPFAVLEGNALLDALDGELVVLARVFAPANVPARVMLEWYLDDALVRTSREVEIVAHEGGFRFWDALRPEGGMLDPGNYRVVLRAAGNRAFGTANLELR